MLAPVTDIARWKAEHSRPVVIDYCRWSEAAQIVAEANLRVFLTTYFVWPRVMLRTCFGV